MKIKIIFFVLLVACWGQQVLCMEIINLFSRSFLSKSKTKQDLADKLKQINETSVVISAELKNLENELQLLKHSFQEIVSENLRLKNYPLDPTSSQESIKYNKDKRPRLTERPPGRLNRIKEQIESIENLAKSIEQSNNALKNKVENEVLLKNDKEFEILKTGLTQMQDAHTKVQVGMTSFKEDFLKFQTDLTELSNDLTSFKAEQATNRLEINAQLKKLQEGQDTLDKKIAQGVPLTLAQKQMMIGVAVTGVVLGGAAVAYYYTIFSRQKA